MPRDGGAGSWPPERGAGLLAVHRSKRTLQPVPPPWSPEPSAQQRSPTPCPAQVEYVWKAGVPPMPPAFVPDNNTHWTRYSQPDYSYTNGKCREFF